MQEEPYTKLSIIALGETGSGKSLFCKLFSGMKDFISERSGRSVTTAIKSKTFRNDEKKVEIELIDTPGFNDTRDNEENPQDQINYEAIQKFLKENNQRINCVLIVINQNTQRVTASLKKAIKSICTLFPLPDFWKHVIIFWTHWLFVYQEDEDNAKNFIENNILDEFRLLSNQIHDDENRINPIENSLHMIFNEYNDETQNEERRRIDKEKSKINFDKLIDLVKNMNPLYKKIFPTIIKIEKQNPLDGIIVANYRQFNYKRVLVRKFEDFSGDIIEREEVIDIFYVHEFESDWTLCSQESTEEIKKYKRYKNRVFIDKNGTKFEPGEEIQIQKKEVFQEKTLIKKTQSLPVDGNPKRKKIFEYYQVQGSMEEEGRKLIEEIEEGETEWEKDNSYNVQNCEKFVKYKTITKYDSNGNLNGSIQRTNEQVDWEIYETSTQTDIQETINATTIRYYDKTKKIKKSKNNPNGVEVPLIDGGISNIKNVEFRPEPDPPLKELDQNHIGQVKYNFYNVKYINNQKVENGPRELNREKSYILYYKKNEDITRINEEKDGKKYEKSYYEIYMIDSRENDPTKRHKTNLKINVSQREIGIKTKIEIREKIKDKKTITKQYYKVYYNIDENGKEHFEREEPDGDPKDELIELSKEDSSYIESPMTIDKINEMRNKKIYPINYKEVYYKVPLNTKLFDKILTGKIDNIELKMIPHEDKEINEEKKYIIFKTEYREFKYINDNEEKDPKIIDKKNIQYDLIIKEETRETYGDEYVFRQKYKIFCYFKDGKEVVDHEEKIDPPKKDKIEYGEEYFKEEYIINPEIYEQNMKLSMKKYFDPQKEMIVYHDLEYDNDYDYDNIYNPKPYLGKHKFTQNNYNSYYPITTNKIPYQKQKLVQIYNKNETKKEELKNKYPKVFRRVYYKDEINTTRHLSIKTGKVENVEIKLEHVNKTIENKEKTHKKIEDYDIEVTYIDGKSYKNEDNKINYKETNIYITKEKIEKGEVKKWFSADEHHFDIYEKTKIVYPDGAVEESRNLIESDKVERYNKKK